MLIGFGHQAVRLTGFSSATIDTDAALESLAVDKKQGTALYDAVSLGSRALADEPNAGRVLIVLTDGDDVSSRTTLPKAAAQAKRAGASVYAIGIEGEDFSPAGPEGDGRRNGRRLLSASSSSPSPMRTARSPSSSGARGASRTSPQLARETRST